MGKMVDRCFQGALALATLFLAYSAMESADTAREAAETTNATAAATREIAEVVKGIAESAERSAEATSTWFEFTQRPFIYPKIWEVTRGTGYRSARVQAQLHDYATVPAAVHKVCIWQGMYLIDYDRRQYKNATVREPSVVFGPVFYRVLFPDSLLSERQGESRTAHLSVVYTFARDGSEQHHIWRADAIANLGTDASGELTFRAVLSVVRPLDVEPCT